MSKELNYIIKACLDGNRSGQKDLYDRYVDRLYFTVQRYVREDYYIQNLLQDIFVKIFLQLDKFDESKGQFFTWINTIAIRSCLNHLRTKKMTFSSFDDLGRELFIYDDMFEKMDIEHLLLIIQEIPKTYSVVFNLYEIDGFKHEEIGKMLNISASTSRAYLTKAKQLIREKIKAQAKISSHE